MAIYVTGDTHGAKQYGFYSVDGFMHRLNIDSFPEQKMMTKDDYVVICGGVWDFKGESPEEKYNLDWLESRNFTTFFVPGNHENYDRLVGINDKKALDSWIFKGLSDVKKNRILNGYPQKEWHGGIVREIRPSVLMLSILMGASALPLEVQEAMTSAVESLKQKNLKAKNWLIKRLKDGTLKEKRFV